MNKMLLKIVFVSLVLGIALSNGQPEVHPCCLKVRVNGYELQNLVFSAEPGTANGRAHYTGNRENLALWYDNENWVIGSKSKQGKTWGELWGRYGDGVYHFVTSEENCPNNLDPWAWKDHKHGKYSSKFEDTTDGVSIVCEN